MIKRVISLSALFLLFVWGCKKEEINFDKIQSPELDPSFAITIGSASLNLGDLEQKFDQDELFYNNGTSLFQFVYSSDVFEFYPISFLNFPAQVFSDQFQLPSGIQSAFALATPGTQVSFSDTNVAAFNFSNGEQLDSASIQSGNMQINISSDFAHDVTIVLTSPYLKLNGNSFQTTINLNYTGSTPVISSNSIDLSGYVLDLSRGGLSTNEIEFRSDITLTHSGQPVLGTEQFDFTYTFNLNTYQGAWGYFGQYVNVLDQDTQSISLFEDLNGGIVHFADPSIEMTIFNTTGIEVSNSFTAIYNPDNSGTTIIGGTGINGIPNIPAANFIGDTAVVTHIINNGNTSPTLTQLLDGGPSKIIYSATATTNPNGFVQNFLSNTSKLWAKADVILPFYGYADNFALVDTIDLNVEETFNFDTSSNFTFDDIEKATLRIITNNGLPVQSRLQIYFADSMNQIIDSLFTVANGENILLPGFVNFNLPISNPNFGKVTSKSKKITDIILTNTKLKKLVDNNSRKMIYRAVINTNEASNGQDIKMYPEYTLDVKVSAKLDLKINLSE